MTISTGTGNAIETNSIFSNTALGIDLGNNGVTLDTGPARTVATRWTARWMIWLEDALLTYVAFT